MHSIWKQTTERQANRKKNRNIYLNMNDKNLSNQTKQQQQQKMTHDQQNNSN